MRVDRRCREAEGDNTIWDNTPIVKLWDAKGRFVRSFGRSDPARDGEVSGGSLSWSPRGDRIAFVQAEAGSVQRLRASRTTRRSEATSPCGTSTASSFSMSRRRVSASLTGARLAWTAAASRLFVCEAANFSGLDARETEAKVWDVATGRVITTIPDCSLAVLDPAGKTAGRLRDIARWITAYLSLECRNGSGDHST